MTINNAPLWRLIGDETSPANEDWDISLPQDGVATGVNFGVPSHYMEFNAESWNIAGGVGVPTTAQILNYQPVGFDFGNVTYIFDGELRFITDETGHVFVPDFAGGDTFTFGSSIAATGEGTRLDFKGGNAVSGNNNGGSITVTGGLPSGTGTPGTINFGEFGLADQGLIIFSDAYTRWYANLDYDAQEEWAPFTTQTSDASDNTFVFGAELEDNSSVRIEVVIQGTETDGSDRGTYRFYGTFYRDGGNVLQQGTTTYSSVETSDLNWNVDFVIDVPGNTVNAYANSNGDTVNWSGYIKSSLVTTA